MKSADFRAWLDLMGRGKPLSDSKAAELLGCSRATVKAYREKTDPPAYVGLACSALALGVPPWRRDMLSVSGR